MQAMIPGDFGCNTCCGDHGVRVIGLRLTNNLCIAFVKPSSHISPELALVSRWWTHLITNYALDFKTSLEYTEEHAKG